MNLRKILFSVFSIGVVGLVAFAATSAYFSDTEESLENTFTAGKLDLIFQADEGDGNFTDVNGAPLFDGATFPLNDLKPGDSGERTVKIWVDDNLACGKVSVDLLEDDGNLNEYVEFAVWKDPDCDNLFDYDSGEIMLVKGTLTEDKAYSLGNLPRVDDECYGIAYCFGIFDEQGVCDGSLIIDNELQEDSFQADLVIEALQQRNQYPNGCPAAGDWTDVPDRFVLRLENENEVEDGPWEVIVDGKYVDMTYNVSGDTFKYMLDEHDLPASTSYDLIYYADGWPGNHPGAYLGTHVTDASGNLTDHDGDVNIGFDLPDPADANSAIGAKIWLVLSSDYDDGNKKMTLWNPGQYLFEGNVYIHYDYN